MSLEQWAALPWWEQRLLTEGLTEEFGESEGGGQAPTTNRTLLNGEPGELSALGFRETNL